MKNAKISVIIPIYNCADCIDCCIQSIYAQSFSDYEIILVNDGSKDNSLEICRRYEKEDSRITVIDKENGGAGSARNAGINVASGEYILFVDADDEIDRCLLEITYNKAKEADYDMVVFAIDIVSTDSKTHTETGRRTTTLTDLLCPTQSKFRAHFIDLYYGGTLFGGPINKLFKTDIIKANSVSFPDLRRGQDEIFNFRFYRFVSSAAVIPDLLYKYYIFDQVGANKKYRLDYFASTTVTYYNTVKELIDFFGLDDEHTKEKFQNSFVYSMQVTPDLAWNPVEKLSRKQKIEFLQSVLDNELVMEITTTVKYVPQSCADFWKCFKQYDAKKLYRFVAREKRIRRLKDFILKCIGRRNGHNNG